jgi:hypothetical protein
MEIENNLWSIPRQKAENILDIPPHQLTYEKYLQKENQESVD